jgi:hypothetical protein
MLDEAEIAAHAAPQLIHKAISFGNSVADSISDPWEEAAELSELPKDTATHRWLR